MAIQTFKLNFEGYWIDEESLPSRSGIYCVYSCLKFPKMVSIEKLIYIGESSDVQDRHKRHEKVYKWKKHLKGEEVLCFSYAKANYIIRDRCEAALIFKHNPPENTDRTESFSFDQTTIELTGKTDKLCEKFTIHPTQ